MAVAPCSGVRSGNLIVVPVTFENSTGAAVAVTADAGFRALGTAYNGVSQTTVFAKVATTADVGRATDYRFDWSATAVRNGKAVVTLVTYKGIDSARVTAVAQTATGRPAASGAVTVSDASRYTLAYFYGMTDVALSSTAPVVGEWTVSQGIWKNTTAGANNANAAAVVTGDVDKTAAGTTAAQTAATANVNAMTASTHWNAVVLVLHPTP